MKKWHKFSIGVTSSVALGGVILDLYLQYFPKWPAVTVFVIVVMMTINIQYPVTPLRLQWVGWGRNK